MRTNKLSNIIMKVSLALILILIILAVYMNWNRITNIAYPFIISVFIAYLLNPLVCKMEQRGIKRTFGIIIIYLIFLGLMLFICFYMMPMIVSDIGKLVADLPGYSARLKGVIESIQDKYSRINLPDTIKNVIDNNVNKVESYISLYLEYVASSIIASLSMIFSIALIPILLYYFLKDFKKIGRKIMLLIPHKYRNHITRLAINIDDVFGNYIRSQIILSAIIAVMTTVVLLVLNIKFAVIIGIINGITNIIPYFGPIIGAAPAVLIALLQSPVKALYTVIAMTIIQQIESDIICPKITADSVGLHPLAVIFSLIIGGELFGMTGLILGVPAAAALKVIYRDIMKDLY